MKVETQGGRVYLPKDTRENLGEKYKLIEMKDRVILIPISSKPLERLKEITSDTDKSASELKDEARNHMIEEAGR
jgi:bifunctional DNA-binding transcriptional regulator/antitoxin component of YhaV-PrlF toxin-antitoxin module